LGETGEVIFTGFLFVIRQIGSTGRAAPVAARAGGRPAGAGHPKKPWLLDVTFREDHNQTRSG
ncbi:MAG: hypothetical protein ACUVSX_16015, partial [Aggregatilineales bacterium]